VWRSSNGLESAGTTTTGACVGEVRIQKGIIVASGSCVGATFASEMNRTKRNESRCVHRAGTVNSFNDRRWISSI
jgi:hypothetical protein